MCGEPCHPGMCSGGCGRGLLHACVCSMSGWAACTPPIPCSACVCCALLQTLMSVCISIHGALAEAPLNAVYFATGDCGPLPNISHAEPLEDTKHRESFTVGSKVRYRCLTGFVKRPLMSETIQCLANSQWSHLPEFCGRKYFTFSKISCLELCAACENIYHFSNRCFEGFLIQSDAP